MRARQVHILEGSTFVVSDPAGDIDARPDEPAGLFYRDMRHLSRWQVRLNGRELEALSGDAIEYDEALFFLVSPTGSPYRNSSVVLIRRRHVGDGMQEHLQLDNHGTGPLRAEISLLFAADFADIFEIKDHLAKVGRFYHRLEQDRVVLGYERADLRRETTIEAPGAFFTESSLAYRVELQPGETWRTDIEISVATEHLRPVPKLSHQPNIPGTLDGWLAAAPRLETDWQDLHRVYRRSLVDLAALRFFPETVPNSSLPAAGLPWFMALFGRDSLLASYQALPFAPELCRTTLRALAAQQAAEFDDFRDAEPGKILHELRHGELTHFAERPHSPYYGSADSTPLFLVVLDEYERWTGDRATVRELEPAARAAMTWIEEHGDLDGDGYLEYRTRNPRTGLVNQCWKDSWNSIVHPDGTLAAGPPAVCEIQGYAYDARRRTARLAREVWRDPAWGMHLDADADALAQRFHRDFWLDDIGCYAFALDGAKAPVPTLTSNVGHLLWSGIVPDTAAERVVAHLTGDRLFSGWGIRTLASGQLAYNPVEYHNGTVWPHDTALVAAGLARYGYREQASRLAVATLEAARYFDDRLPEVFVGYDRHVTRMPVEYPTACSPQAWATGTPLLLLRVLLGLDPTPERLLSKPHLVAPIGSLALRGIPGRWGRDEVQGTP
ncbi:glycogen debranching enzyme [Krasilnikovia cinnamomea]|uniref:Glycogen debranching enzyme n=1 Tax=Krasilnikovia cinnamomea TaxID=349313 RepID=A0A4Q7ZNY8_9ACTN|nr:glycogen debranching N-terminal domain-containing protein [Krasilnikovia cinnamomea]RZU52767.1 glycogen debranching enzyme [Krasilnikovia cinnamomea]